MSNAQRGAGAADRRLGPFAFVTAEASLPDDHDMPLLLAACNSANIRVEVRSWHEAGVDWSQYRAVVLRSPWDYGENRSTFLSWCEQVAAVTMLLNPLSVIRWGTDKHYLGNLDQHGVPIVPSLFMEPHHARLVELARFIARHADANSFVIKPSIGCYSKNVKRFERSDYAKMMVHVRYILDGGCSAIVQPYLSSIDQCGETNLIYFDGVYSHAIRKAPLLLVDGTVNVPTYDFRSACDADDRERQVACAALDAVQDHLGLIAPLLCARIDLIRDNAGMPRILEFDISEPSLSLPLAEAGAARFARALIKASAAGASHELQS